MSENQSSSSEHAESEKRRWIIKITNWTPVSINAVDHHWTALRKAIQDTADRLVIESNNQKFVRVSDRYRPRRRVRLFTYHTGKRPDPHNLAKVFCDAMVHAGYIVDDSSEWLDWITPSCGTSDCRMTYICVGDFTAVDPDPWPHRNVAPSDMLNEYLGIHPKPLPFLFQSARGETLGRDKKPVTAPNRCRLSDEEYIKATESLTKYIPKSS